MDTSILPADGAIATLATRRSDASVPTRIGIGFETLDRRMFRPERCYDLLAAAGVGWARCQTGWSRCETVPGRFDFAWLDEVVDNLLRRGIRPWFNVGFGNRIYMPDAPHESAVGCVPLYYPQAVQDAWLRYVGALARHFHGRVDRFEVWNECNTDCFWRPGKASAAEYARLVAMTSRAIKAVIPDALVIACVAGTANEFILGTLKAGIGAHIDRYSVHPYQDQVLEANYPAAIANLRALLAVHAPHVKLWQGECGCPSQTLGHHDEWLQLYNMDETKQAKWLLRRLLTDLALDLDHVSYFHATDLMEGEYRQASGEIRPPVMMGVLHGRSYEPKRSYAALARLCALFDECTRAAPLFTRGYLHHLGRCESRLADAAMQYRTFIRDGFPLYGWYLPEDVQLEMPVRKGFTLHVMEEAERRIEDPVLLDLLQGTVHALPPFVREAADGACLAFHQLPLADYPLFLTDRRALA